MYKIEADKAQSMIAVIEEHRKIPQNILSHLEKAVDRHITPGETKDFYQGFLSAISLSLELQEQNLDKSEVNAALVQLMKRTSQLYLEEEHEEKI
ncbi:hypothetical protein [Aliterella atlantica]|uniref:Uncharacterized protein n=1 Tax=Aliterella atlantica CENA595 TaxID=1618023 RepID=A0A0D8ZM36_9CYAN|nr:hypothetical protein [Aliterella atlantica]KJH69795.1 hypothetical protein UH38_22050 [Aliterella atlantica CENA595]